MKSTRLILIIFITVSFFSAFSQTITATVGNFNFYNPFDQFPAPYGRYYESTHHQFLIRASELLDAGAEAGEIESIAFKVAETITGGDPLAGYTIKMKQTNATYITAFDLTNLTEVYYSYSYTASIGWNTHDFSTPFLWDGSSNILVDICNDFSLNTPTNYNSGTYNTLYTYNCYVYGGDNAINQCDQDDLIEYLYAKPDFRVVVTPSVPECAEIVFPENQSTGISRTPTLDWFPGSSYVTDYDVYFGTSPNPPFVTVTTATSYSPETLEGITTYYWKIVPKNISGGAVGCEVWSFTTNSGMADCSEIIYPIDGSTDVLVNPVLEWQSSSDATYYNIYAGIDPNPEFVGSTTGTSFNTDFINEPNTTYYWKVEPVSLYGSNDTCAVHSFTTYSYCPVNPVPSNGQTDQLTYQHLSWDSVVDAEMYYIYLGKNPEPPLIDSSVTNSYFINDLNINSQYYWKIITKLGYTISSGCDLWTFNTKDNTHWFVKLDGNDANDGLSWDQAKASLSEVMYMAECSDSIHVAEGNYFPVIDTSNNLNPADEKSLTFPLIAGVDLLGGYPATASGSDLQSSLNVPRDYYTHITVLNGDIGETNDSTDNCRHVVTMFGDNYGTALLDGFSIINGYSGNTYNYDYFGAAIILKSKKLSIDNCYLTRNNTTFGSGIYAFKSNITVNNSKFLNNNLGAAIYVDSYSKLNVSNSCFFSNFQAIRVMNYTSLISDNCTYWWNTQDDYDIEMINAGDDPVYSSYIKNSTIFQFGKSYGGQVYFDNCLLGGASNVSQMYYKYTIKSYYYYDSIGVSSSVPQIYYWLDYPPADNGGNTLTCKLLPYNGKNPAVGTGNPEYGGLPDQRGVMRAATPCLGAYEAPYAVSSDILINDTSLCEGENAALNVASATIENPVFKWYSDSTLSTLINTGSIYITPALTSSVYYYITVENDSVYANPISFAKKMLVYVGDLPLIVNQPLSISECLGNSASFRVNAAGNDLSFQWFKDNIEMPEETDSLLIFTNINNDDVGQYYCEISSGCGGVQNSDTVELICFIPPEIVEEPQNDTVLAGENVIFSLISTGSIIGYQWQIGIGNVFSDLIEEYPFTGVNSNTLIIENTQDTLNSYAFRCMVTGSCDSIVVSDTVNLYAVAPPQIYLNTQDQSVCLDEPVSFFINAEGTDLEYLWQVDEGSGFCNLIDDSIYSGCQNDSLKIISASKPMSGNQYRCLTYNFADSIYSNPAYLFVDEISPVIISTYNDLEIDANENCEVILADYTVDVIATDNCDTSLVITQFPVAGSAISGAINPVTLTATDNVGNADEVTFNIAVVDNTNPEITSSYDNDTINADENCEAVLPDYTGEVMATDNCDTMLTISQEPVPGTIISGITNTITLTATDDADNFDEISFNVEVADNTPPDITCVDDQEIILNDGQSVYTVQGTEFDPLEVSDNCGIDYIENDYNMSAGLDGAEISVGTTTIIWTVIDNTGNSDTCSFVVSIYPYVNVLKLEPAGVLIYPNPTKGKIIVEFEENRFCKIEIFNLNGQIVLHKDITGPKETLNLSNFKNGLYLLSIGGENEKYSTKIFINR